MSILFAFLLSITSEVGRQYAPFYAAPLLFPTAMSHDHSVTYRPEHYELFIVFLSVLVSMLSSWVAFDLSDRIRLQVSECRRLTWLAAGAVAMGAGVWAMHYVGMLACEVDGDVRYHWPTVLLSMLAAVLASGVALHLVSENKLSWSGATVGGLFMGGGIAAMHYIGMSAMRVPMDMHFSGPKVLLSVVVAVSVATASLRLASKSGASGTGWSKKKLLSALLMGSAISVMHYVGMSATYWSSAYVELAPTDLLHTIPASRLSIVTVLSAAVIVSLLALASAGFDRIVSRFQSALAGSRWKNSQLWAHNARLQEAFRIGGVGIWECDPKTGLFYVDDILRDLFEVPHNGKPVPREIWKCSVHPDDVDAVDERWNNSLADGDVYENEYRIIQNGGSVRRVRTVASVIRQSNGTPHRVLGMTWDVTTERERELHIAKQATRFRMTLEAIGDAVISTDENRHVIFLNRAATALTGWESESACGKPLAEIFVTRDEETDALRRDPVQRCIESGGTFLSEDGVLISKAGERHNIRKHVALMDEGHAAVLTFQDITESRRMQKALEHAATHDSLTGLPNRAAFEKRLAEQWLDCQSNARTHCLCMLDLDRFKLVNDTSGHLAGDALLRQIATTLQNCLEPNDIVARMGGDEFMVLLTDTDGSVGESRARHLLKNIDCIRFAWRGRTYDISASAGLVHFQKHSPRPADLISQADVSVYTSKRHGRNQVSVYSKTEGVAHEVLQEMEIVTDMRQSLEQNRFELHVQPIVPTDAPGSKRYFEVLTRMIDERGDLVSPGFFIPAAERYGLMGSMDRWVISNVLNTYQEFHQEHPNLCFAINLSAESLSDPTLWSFVAAELQRTQIPPVSICFEVTETGLIQNLETATKFMEQARSIGCRISLDDFGTGLSSLSYLQQFPVDTIKIDAAFVKNLQDDKLDQSIVSSVAQIARSINVVTVAEGVENLNAIRLLRQLGIDFVQGWATGRSTPLKSMLELSSLSHASFTNGLQKDLPLTSLN